MSRGWLPWWTALADLIWPLRCPVCTRELNDAVLRSRGGVPSLHAACLKALPVVSSSRPRPEPGWAPVRWHYADAPAYFSLLHAAKYEGRLEVLDPLAQQFGAWVAERRWLPRHAVLVPVPDDPERARRRGGSLPLRIADWLGEAAGRPVRSDLLWRRPGGPPVSTLTGAARRRRALAGRFRVGRLPEVPRRATLVLVDDQLTTGATAREALRLLSSRGHPLLVLALAGSSGAPAELRLTGRNAHL